MGVGREHPRALPASAGAPRCRAAYPEDPPRNLPPLPHLGHPSGGGGDGDGVGLDARFWYATCLAADGRGRLFIGDTDCIRTLHTLTCDLTTLLRVSPAERPWIDFAYVDDAEELLTVTMNMHVR